MARSVTRIIGLAIALVCLGYFAVKAREAWPSADAGFTFDVLLPRLFAGSLILLISYFATAFSWISVLRALGTRLPPLSGLGIYFTAQFAKYLPGTVGQYVGRAALAVGRGYPGSTVALSLTLELALLLGLAGLLSLPMLGIVVRYVQGAWQGVNPLKLVLIVVPVILIAAGVIVFALRRWPLLARAREWLTNLRATIRPMTAAWLCIAALLSLTGLWLASICLLALGDTLLNVGLRDLVLVVSLYCVAWLVGVLTPGVPVGLGVREAILVQGLTPLMGGAHAVAAALLFRLLTTLSDAALFGAGLLLLKLSAHRTRDPIPRSL